MFTRFMVDASNILSFKSESENSNLKYSLEFWIFKPKPSGKQVLRKKDSCVVIQIYFQVCASESQSWRKTIPVLQRSGNEGSNFAI